MIRYDVICSCWFCKWKGYESLVNINHLSAE